VRHAIVQVNKNMAPSIMGICAQTDILVRKPNMIKVPPNICAQQTNNANGIFIFNLLNLLPLINK